MHFQPLGMKDSGYDRFETILPHRSTGDSRQGDTWVNSAYIDMTIPHGAGALYSTVEDFFRWYQCWREHKILSSIMESDDNTREGELRIRNQHF